MTTTQLLSDAGLVIALLRKHRLEIHSESNYGIERDALYIDGKHLGFVTMDENGIPLLGQKQRKAAEEAL